MEPPVLQQSSSRISRLCMSATCCDVKQQKLKKGRWRCGAVGKKTRFSETDFGLQRTTIKLCKYHYQIFSKVAFVEY